MLPAIGDFLKEPLSERRARIAAIELFHTVDYYSLDDPQNRSAPALTSELIAGCREFLLIRDAANASKHGLLTRDGNPRKVLSKSEQLRTSRGLFGAPWGDPESVFAESAEMLIREDDDTYHSFKQVVFSAVRMWARILSISTESLEQAMKEAGIASAQ